jgi:hypothetical protein
VAGVHFNTVNGSCVYMCLRARACTLGVRVCVCASERVHFNRGSGSWVMDIRDIKFLVPLPTVFIKRYKLYINRTYSIFIVDCHDETQSDRTCRYI